MERKNALLHDVNAPRPESESPPRSQRQQEPAAASTGNAENGKDSPPDRSRGIPSTQSPQDFYAELTQRPDIRQILAELAKR